MFYQHQNTHRPPHVSIPDSVYFITGRTYFAFPHFRSTKALDITKDSLREACKRHRIKMIGYVLLTNHYHIMVKTPTDMNYTIGKFIGQFHGRTSYLFRHMEDNSINAVSPSSGSDRLEPVDSVNSINIVTPNVRNDRIYPVYDLTGEEFNYWKNEYLLKMGKQYIDADIRGREKFQALIDQRDIQGLTTFVREEPKIFHQYLDRIIRNEIDLYRHLNYIHQNPVKHGYTKTMEEWKYSSYVDYLREKGQEWLDSCFEKYPIVDFTPQDELTG